MLPAGVAGVLSPERSVILQRFSPSKLLEEFQMSRFRGLTSLALIATATATLAFSGCIFSPDKAPPPPPTPAVIPTNEAEVIKALEEAYRHKDVDAYAKILHTGFRFILDNATDSWDRTEELRIHRRMFKPQDTVPGEQPVPMDLWLVNVDITLTPRNPAWLVDTQYYASPTNPGGLDSDHFKVTQNEYSTSVFFKTQGQNDYQVTGHANFVIVNNLDIPVGTDGKFLVYLMEDLGAQKPTPPPAL